MPSLPKRPLLYAEYYVIVISSAIGCSTFSLMLLAAPSSVAWDFVALWLALIKPLISGCSVYLALLLPALCFRPSTLLAKLVLELPRVPSNCVLIFRELETSE